MTESTGTPFAIYFSYPAEIEHSELLTSSLLNELHSFEKLAVINFNLLSHKLLNLNNHWSCFKSFENIVSEFHSCRIPTSWKLKQSPFKYNKMRWGKKSQKRNWMLTTLCNPSLQYSAISWHWQKLSQAKKMLLVIDLFQICLFFVTCYQATVKPHHVP